MKWERIKLTDFRGVKALDLDLAELDRAVIIGRNGAGKSSAFIYGPLFALFGAKAVNVARPRHLVRRGATACEALLEFTTKGDRWRVERTYSIRTKAGASSLELSRFSEGEWRPAAAGNIFDVQAAIDDLLGCSMDAMVCGSIIRQGEADRFTSAKATDRLTFLADLLGAAAWRKALKLARAEQSAASTELAALSTQVAQTAAMKERQESLRQLCEQHRSGLAGLPDPVDQSATRAELATLGEAEAANMKAVELAREPKERADKLKADIERGAQAAAEYQRNVANNAGRTLAGRKTLAELPDKTTVQTEAKRTQLATITVDADDFDSIVETGKALAAELDTAKAHLNNLASARARLNALAPDPLAVPPDDCNVLSCQLRQGADRQDKRRELAAAEVAYKASGAWSPEKVATTEAALVDLRKQATAAKDASRIIGELADIERTAAASTASLTEELASLERSAAEFGERLAQANEAQTALKTSLAKAEAELGANLDNILAESKRIATRRGELDAIIRDGDQRNSHLTTKRADFQRAFDQSEARLAELTATLGELDAALVERTAELKHRSDVLHHVETFAKAAPHMVVAGKVGTIETTANEVLQTTYPGARVSISNSRILASGETKDEITVSVWADGVEAPIETFSGGERFRLDLAIRIGISSAAGAQSSTLVVDEGFGTQDDEALADVKTALRHLSTRFQRVFIISHRIELGDLFADVIDLNGELNQ